MVGSADEVVPHCSVVFCQWMNCEKGARTRSCEDSTIHFTRFNCYNAAEPEEKVAPVGHGEKRSITLVIPTRR